MEKNVVYVVGLYYWSQSVVVC